MIGKRYRWFIVAAALAGCGTSELRPVELFPEDECAHCRMSVSDPKFASEIITQNGEVFKFDDLSCLDKFRKHRNDQAIAAIFVKDFETTRWLRYEQSVIIETGIATPMGSGKIAVSGSERAAAVKQQFPARSGSCEAGCCGS